MRKPNGPHITFKGLGTEWWVELLETQDFPDEIAQLVRTTTTLFDDTYSRFKHTSLIGQLNLNKRLPHPPQELLDMFTFAHKMHRVTKGSFDISVGGTLQRLGYGDTNTARANYSKFWNEVKYNREEICIPNKTAVDFGGFGKGWLLDKLAVLLEQNGITYYLINGGGDIVLSAKDPVELGLEHPYEPGAVIGTTRLTRGALAVSSVVKRRWNKNNETHHHIIDPLKDAATDTDVVTTYVRGETALITDTLATAALVRPAMKEQLEKQFHVGIITLTRGQL